MDEQKIVLCRDCEFCKWMSAKFDYGCLRRPLERWHPIKGGERMYLYCETLNRNCDCPFHKKKEKKSLWALIKRLLRF
jgi:hypothetical protein